MKRRDNWCWIGLGAFLLALFAAGAALIGFQWQSSIKVIEHSTSTETDLIASLIQNDLQHGNYQHVPVLLGQWGAKRDKIAVLRVTSGNGFVIGEYNRPTPAIHSISMSHPIAFSYSGRATLQLTRDTSSSITQRHDAIIQLGVGYVIVAALVIALTHLLLLHRREATALRKRSIELDETNHRLEQEIVVRVSAQDELQRYREQLEFGVKQRTSELQQANHELESFSYSVSHDLRAPLRGIDGFSQLILEDFDAKLDDSGRDALRRIRAAAQRMGHIIDDLLKLARITRAKLNIERVDLSEIANSIFNELRDREPDRVIKISVQSDLVCWGDSSLIRLALENLASNAWKFTRHCSSAEIQIGETTDGGRSAFYIKDNGTGFDMTHASRLFEPFQRVHSNADFEGIGIGLATVRRIVERNGGEIWARAEQNNGAIFFFTLPLIEEGRAKIGHA